MWEYNYSDELYHYGRKGMKWGIRLYQNSDGSLTSLGKKRYGTKSNFNKVQAAKKAASPEKLRAAKAKAKAQARTEAEIAKYKKKADEAVNGKPKTEKPASEKKTIFGSKKETQKPQATTIIRDKRAVKKMSDAELDSALTRLQKEQRYKDMIDGENVKKGKAAFSDALTSSAKQALTTVATAGFTYAGKQGIKKLLGPEYEDAWNEMFSVKKSKTTSSLINDLRNGRTRLEDLNDDEIADISRRTNSENVIRDRLGLNRTNATTTTGTRNVENNTTSPVSSGRRRASRGPSVTGSTFSRSPNRHTTTTSETSNTRRASRGPSVTGSTFSRSPNRHTTTRTTSNLPAIRTSSTDQTLRGTVEPARRRRATRGPRATGIRPSRSSSTQLVVRNNRWW